jgi:hypothetical protein
MCIQKAVELKPQIHSTGNHFASVWPLSRLCYRPAVFSRHYLSLRSQTRKQNVDAHFEESHYSKFLLLKMKRVAEGG